MKTKPKNDNTPGEFEEMEERALKVLSVMYLGALEQLTAVLDENDLSEYSDKGRRRPGIKGTIDKLNASVQTLLKNRDTTGAARMITYKTREAYGVWS